MKELDELNSEASSAVEEASKPQNEQPQDMDKEADAEGKQSMPEGFDTKLILTKSALDEWAEAVFEPFEGTEKAAVSALENPDVFAAAAEPMISKEEIIETIKETAEEAEQAETAASVLELSMPEISETAEALDHMAKETYDSGVFSPVSEAEGSESSADEALMQDSEGEEIEALENPDVFAAAAKPMISEEKVIETIAETAEETEQAEAASMLELSMPEISKAAEAIDHMAKETYDSGVFSPVSEAENSESSAAEALMQDSEGEEIEALENPDVFAASAEPLISEEKVIEAIAETAEEAEQAETENTVLESAMPELFETEEPVSNTGSDNALNTEENPETKPAAQEPMVEQLSLLEDQLPHLEAANAPEARKAKAVLEGLLFLVGDDGITAEQAAATLDIAPELAKEYFDDLMKVYLDDARGIEIANYGGTYRFLSKASVHEYARKLFQISKQATLSQAALETLAIIAYKQPITRVEIEEIRGVGADMMLRKLMARDLIRESGRSEAAGRPILYEVTEEFMNSFKLMSLKELPELPQFNESEESEDLFEQ